MNERIQQMIYSLNEKVGVHWTNEGKLKFAELIVKECVEVIEAARPGVEQFPAEVALDIVSKNMKVYLGVE